MSSDRRKLRLTGNGYQINLPIVVKANAQPDEWIIPVIWYPMKFGKLSRQLSSMVELNNRFGSWHRGKSHKSHLNVR